VTFRVTTLNMEQDHKRWEQRRHLIGAQMGELAPDLFALNEICFPKQTGRWLQRIAKENFGISYALVQQSKSGALQHDGEGILSRFPIVETANLDYRTHNAVAAVARVEIEGRLLDFYVTHLYMSRGDDALRLFQVQQLLAWIGSRDDVEARIVCGDFNATLDMPSASLMAKHFAPSQTTPTAFSPLADSDGSVTHPYWPRADRCIDYIWVAGPLRVIESGVCFNKPSPHDPTLWPSDHMGVWADLAWT
jgi:endonuclease/exonuclease/phosphatase family metal-dependent hydrolase